MNMCVLHGITDKNQEKVWPNLLNIEAENINYKIIYYCSYFLSVPVKYSITKSNLGRKEYISSYRL